MIATKVLNTRKGVNFPKYLFFSFFLKISHLKKIKNKNSFHRNKGDVIDTSFVAITVLS
jgi:hypothetical protein